MEPEKRKAGRPPRRKPNEKLGNSIKIEDEAARILEIQAKKLKVAKGKFASAAIAYCVQAGINPLDAQATSLGSVSQKVEAGVASVRAHNADIGNRLYALTRGLEKTIYPFMQQQQHATYAYIEAVESNLLRHLIALETNLLNPMIEEIVKGTVEAHVGRIIGERAYLKVTGRAPEEWSGQHVKFNGERDQIIAANLREFIKEHKVPVPQSSIKPGATPVPPTPVAPASTAPPATPKS